MHGKQRQPVPPLPSSGPAYPSGMAGVGMLRLDWGLGYTYLQVSGGPMRVGRDEITTVCTSLFPAERG